MITPAGRGRGGRSGDAAVERVTLKHAAMNWAQRLKRVFGIEIERCRGCGGRLGVIASIEDPELIERILCYQPRPILSTSSTAVPARIMPRMSRRHTK